MFNFYFKNREKIQIAKNILMVDFLGEDFVAEHQLLLSFQISEIISSLYYRLRQSAEFIEPERGAIIEYFNRQPQHVQNCFIAMACKKLHDNGNDELKPPMFATKWYSPNNPIDESLYSQRAIDISFKGFVTDLKRLGYWSENSREIHPSSYGIRVYLWSQEEYPNIVDSPGKYVIFNSGTNITTKSKYMASHRKPTVQKIRGNPYDGDK